MPEAQSPKVADPRERLHQAELLMREQAWEQLAAIGAEMPMPLQGVWLEVADAVAFAFGQLREWKVAIGLLEHAYEVAPTWRRASSLAYQYYDASLALCAPRGPQPEQDKDALRQGFRRWIGEALRLRPDSIKDLYRLGVFEAQVESRHDKPALRAFLHAIELYRALPDPVRERRGDLRKASTRALYAAGRSALRLRKVGLARKLAFACIREDDGVDHVDPVHKFHLAARVCLENGELDPAERAARLALDAKGPPRRDYLFGLLSDIALRRPDPAAACAWIERNVPEHSPTVLRWSESSLSAPNSSESSWRSRRESCNACADRNPFVRPRCAVVPRRRPRQGQHPSRPKRPESDLDSRASPGGAPATHAHHPDDRDGPRGPAGLRDWRHHERDG
ncbi:MAG: hypothetical protein MUF54_13540 [Polyangiaceae bacterium]|jgi:hypothetical protein|nr:hypothetical protein [Polyangiaceae bacterium]